MEKSADTPRLDLDPFDANFLANPYAHHETLREAGAVIWLESIGAYAMARYEEVKHALSDWQVFSSSRGVGLADFAKEPPFRTPSLLLETDPPVHDLTRTVMNKVVSLANLKGLAPAWKAKADDLVDTLVSRRRIDAVKDLAEVYPMLVFPDAVGLPNQGREHLLRYATAVFNSFGPRNDIFERGNEGLGPSLEWISSACRIENLSATGWGAEVHRRAEEVAIPVEQRELLVRSLLSAGVDTTVNGIGNLLYAFSLYPDQWDRLRSDPSLGKRAIEESLRWGSTVQTFFRTTTRDVTVAGTRIPEGSKVLLFLAAANRDPRKWEDPERFDIARMSSGHVGFGFGIHQYLGQMVARQEAELILGALTSRVRAIHPAGAPQRRLNNTLYALASLPVELEAA